MIRSVIVDDEQYSREVLKENLLTYCPNIEVVETADCLKSAKYCIELHRPDLVFLDIEMPNGNGFDLLKSFDKIFFKVIFVTAFDEFALQAFQFSASNYLLKPVGPRELREAVEKVRHEISLEINSKNLEVLLQFSQEATFNFNTLVVANLDGFTVFKINEIIFCEADGYVTKFHLTGNNTVISSRHLKYYENILIGKGFMRVHHSFLVNLCHVKSCDNQGVIYLTDNLNASLGGSYKKKFINWLIKFK